jgi:hypothetical protein
VDEPRSSEGYAVLAEEVTLYVLLENTQPILNNNNITGITTFFISDINGDERHMLFERT